KIKLLIILVFFCFLCGYSIVFLEISTEVGDGTFFTFRTARQTYVPPVKDQPMMGDGNRFFREILYQLLLNGQRRCRAARQAEAVTNPEHMRVYRHGGVVVHHRRNYVGRFSAYTRKFDKVFYFFRNDTAKLLNEFTGHA